MGFFVFFANYDPPVEMDMETPLFLGPKSQKRVQKGGQKKRGWFKLHFELF